MTQNSTRPTYTAADRAWIAQAARAIQARRGAAAAPLRISVERPAPAADRRNRPVA